MRDSVIKDGNGGGMPLPHDVCHKRKVSDWRRVRVTPFLQSLTRSVRFAVERSKKTTTDEQIEQRLLLVENKYPHLFTQHPLKSHITWQVVEGTDTLTWKIHAHFAGNLPANLKVEVSKIMNPLTKGGYKVADPKE